MAKYILLTRNNLLTKKIAHDLLFTNKQISLSVLGLIKCSYFIFIKVVETNALRSFSDVF